MKKTFVVKLRFDTADDAQAYITLRQNSPGLLFEGVMSPDPEIVEEWDRV